MNRIGCSLLPSSDHRMRPRASQRQDDLHGNMHELDKVSDESHDGESDGYGSTELDVFYEGARSGSDQPGRERRWYGARPRGLGLTLLRRFSTSVDELFSPYRQFTDSLPYVCLKRAGRVNLPEFHP